MKEWSVIIAGLMWFVLVFGFWGLVLMALWKFVFA